MLRFRYFQNRVLGLTEPTACQWPTDSNVNFVPQLDMRLVWGGGESSVRFCNTRMRRFCKAFTRTFVVVPQGQWYLCAKAQLVQCVPHLSGHYYWRKIWNIPQFMWQQLEDEYFIINNQQPWSEPEWKAYAALSLAIYWGTWQCKSHYYAAPHPDDPEERVLSYASEDEIAEINAALDAAGDDDRTRAGTDEPNLESVPQTDGETGDSAAASAAGGTRHTTAENVDTLATPRTTYAEIALGDSPTGSAPRNINFAAVVGHDVRRRKTYCCAECRQKLKRQGARTIKCQCGRRATEEHVFLCPRCPSGNFYCYACNGSHQSIHESSPPESSPPGPSLKVTKQVVDELTRGLTQGNITLPTHVLQALHDGHTSVADLFAPGGPLSTTNDINQTTPIPGGPPSAGGLNGHE